MVVASIECLYVENDALQEDGWIRLDKAGTVTINGLDGYAKTTLLTGLNMLDQKNENFADSKIFNYSLSKSSKEPKILNDLYRETYLKVLNPKNAKWSLSEEEYYHFVSKIMRPKTILRDWNLYIGYSTICLSEGLDKNGSIHTIDHNEELLVIQNKYFKKAGISEKVKQYTGDATKIIKKLNLDFDLVFIDADKENYPLYFDLIIEKVKPGGVIIADNILWSGKILEKS